jgi:hypothetical protein
MPISRILMPFAWVGGAMTVLKLYHVVVYVLVSSKSSLVVVTIFPYWKLKNVVAVFSSLCCSCPRWFIFHSPPNHYSYLWQFSLDLKFNLIVALHIGLTYVKCYLLFVNNNAFCKRLILKMLSHLLFDDYSLSIGMSFSVFHMKYCFWIFANHFSQFLLSPHRL